MVSNVMNNSENSPKLSIIVPVYNVAEFLTECVESILRQTYNNWELILVDDGSSDGSDKLCDDLKNRDARIKVIHKENGGLSSARNAGLDVMSGEYVTFVDSDDVILGDDTFSRLLEILENDVTLDAVQYDVLFKYLSPYEHTRRYPFKVYTGAEEILKGYLNENIHVSCCDKIFRTKIFETVRFPLKEISEDIATIPDMLERMNSIRTTEIGYYGYRYREGSISCSALPYWKICSILRSYSKYLTYAQGFPRLREQALAIYTRVFWNYASTVRLNYPDKLKDFINQPFFIRVPLRDWRKMDFSAYSAKTRLSIFILCVCGIKSALRFQRLFTRK